VVRFPGADGERLGVDRRVERRALTLAEKIGLGAAVLHCDPRSGALVTRYLESRPLRVEGAAADDTIDRLASALRLLHGQDLRLPLVNVAERIRHYARDVQMLRPRQWPKARELLGATQHVLERYRFTRWDDALCHNDLVAQNILEVKGGLRIIDWEYAGRGDPFFDLATLAEDGGFSNIDRKRLLLAYGEIGDSALERLHRMRVLYRLVSVFWYMLRRRGRDTTLTAELRRQEQALQVLLQQGPED
jgi:thiamine kinase-like enzyme